MKPALQWAREVHEMVRYSELERAIIAVRQEMAAACAELAKAHVCVADTQWCQCSSAIGAAIEILHGGTQ